jgi:murein DD-endopeptidase MepM/ murein hydrolase activator NlpD
VSDAITEAIGDAILPRASRAELVWSLAEVYDWVVDFSRDVQPGDRFKVLAEREISTDGEVRYGRILAARLDVGPRPLYAYRYDDADGRDAFWDESGKSMKRALLRAPLEYKHMGSGFSKSRYHPILHYYRPHLGIDFGAAYGAPVRSVGKGTVTFAGRMGGYGNMVEIRHSSTQTTRYAHLSDFGPGVHVGAHVEQGQMIGRVGASGLATSPHLHYELRISGRAVNPRRLGATGDGQPIAAARHAAFDEERHRLESMLESSASAPAARVD